MKIDWDKEITRIVNSVIIASLSYSIWLTLLPLFIPPTSPFLFVVVMMIGIGAALFTADFNNFRALPQFKHLLIGSLVLPIWPVIRAKVLRTAKSK
tara:strand:- start:36764 stop:37051 length:288 start_codon:yes stop_codon:yes gene_type:complete